MKNYIIVKIDGDNFYYLTANKKFVENREFAYIFESYEFCERIIKTQLDDGTYEIYEI